MDKSLAWPQHIRPSAQENSVAVNLIRYRVGEVIAWGVLRDHAIIPLAGDCATTGAVLSAFSHDDLASVTGSTLPFEAVRLECPVTRNQQFICQGLNYRQHSLESGADPAKGFNMIFTKASSCLCAADSPLIKPRQVRFLDYEIELGLILARDIDGPVAVTADTLHRFIAGVAIVNDYSARDIQIPQSQFYKGKSFRSFGPVGPWITLLSADEMHYLEKFELRLSVNGEERQRGHTGQWLHGPAATLSELSGVQDLFAGDLIATGTPAGCALAMPGPGKQKVAGLLPEAMKWELFLEAQARRPQYLQVGDLVEASIRSTDGRIDLGLQRNRVVEAPA